MDVTHCKKLSVEQIARWAESHHRRTGKWPTKTSGALAGTPETWNAIRIALYQGRRGLRGGSTLARLMQRLLQRVK